ncbi:hypothetical protein ASE66_13535 [Bosea sp. Root483D1]|uniref:hypothetical protein n=1 Tax=Bosea sp. Root483D1 TaxID=1736544 RepID=UPI00070B566A|nr:hypothetical protein [Bosea sp. Root483D1]KRE14399.1 hypothetical protein ASE66_13535 [Bosea sp. Root483D1]
MATVPDFGSSSLTWKTRSGHSGGWRLIATAAKLDADGNSIEEYGLAPMVMAGNVAGDGPLGKSPAYSYQILASQHRHVIFRTHARDGRCDDTESENATLFEQLAIDIRQVRAEKLGREEIQPDLLRRCGTLIGIVEYREGAERWRLAFPVNHLTYGPPGAGPVLQLETGPLPVPSTWFGARHESACQASFHLAFLFWRDWSRLEFQAPAQGRDRHSDAVGRLERAGTSLSILAGR